jgi:hypothetical protein
VLSGIADEHHVVGHAASGAGVGVAVVLVSFVVCLPSCVGRKAGAAPA